MKMTRSNAGQLARKVLLWLGFMLFAGITPVAAQPYLFPFVNLSVTPTTAAVGATISLSAVVAQPHPQAPVPSGTLSVNWGDGTAVVVVAATTASLTHQYAIAGYFRVTVDYSGDGNFFSGSSFADLTIGGPPTSVTVSAGSGQNATVATAFGTPLSVVVRNAANQVFANAPVTFSPPGSGATASLSATTVTTTLSGIASVTATAGTVAGAYSVNASVAGIASPATFALTNNPGAPASITVNTGSGQSATVATAFASSLSATVRDAYSNPVPNVTVTFAAPGSGATASLGAPTAITNASGIATVAATAGTVAGSYSVTASAAGVAAPATYALTNTAGAPALVAVNGGSGQSAIAGYSFALPLSAAVRDAFSNPVSGVSVGFAAPPSGATANLSATAAITNASGLASITATAGTATGAYSVTATVAGVASPAAFSLSNLANLPTSITLLGGNNQTVAAGTAFPTPLSVTVRNALNDPVANATVTFTPPPSGASAVLSAPTANTNSLGVASVTATANGTGGSYGVSAAVSGVASPVTFNLTNIPAPTIAAVTPSVGLLVGGNSVVITGTNFTGATSVSFGGTPAPSFTIDSATMITATTPARPAGVVDVVVTTPGGTATGTGLFTYGVAPTVTINQSAGQADPTAGGPIVFDVVFSAPVTGFDASDVSITSSAGPVVASVSGGPATYTVSLSGMTQSGIVSVSIPAGGAFAAGGIGNLVSTSTDNSVTYVVPVPPTITASFAPPSIVAGAQSVLTLTVTNPNPVALSGIAMSSTLPTSVGGLAIVAPTTCSGAGLLAGSTVSFSGTTLAAGASCTVAVSVSSQTAGSYTYTTGAVTSSNPPTAGGTANAVLTVTPAAPASIAATGGTPQSTTIGTAFAQTLAVVVRDAFNNPVPGASVTFAAPSSGASAILSTTTATTNASGLAVVSATANTVAGSYAVSASVTGVGAPVTFALTNNPGAPATIAVNGGSGQSATISTAFGQPLSAIVRDAGGNAVPSATVTYTPPASGASATLASSTATTNGSGLASVAATANALAGAYNVTASVGAVSTAFALTNNPGANVITFNSLPNRTFGSGSFSVSASASSGLAVSFASGTPATCGVAGATVSLLAAGACSIIASQAGNANYVAASPVTQTFTILQAAVTVSLASTSASGFVGQAITLTATVAPSAAPGTVTFFDGATPVCAAVALAGGVATCATSFATGGTHAITARYDGSANYAVATSSTVTITITDQTTKTAQVIGKFLSQRNNQILSNGPDEGRQIDRLNGGSGSGGAPGFTSGFGRDNSMGGGARASGGLSLLGRSDESAAWPFPASPFDQFARNDFESTQGGGRVNVGPMQFSGSAEGTSRFGFGTSLAALMRQAEAAEQEKSAGLDFADRDRVKVPRAALPFDFWIDGKYGSFRDTRGTSAQDGHFGIVSVGADYVFGRNLLVGTMVQFDSMQQKSLQDQSDIKGTGFLVGPYGTLRLSDNVFLQGRAAWGRTKNDVSPFMTYTDRFESERWLLSATISGRWHHGGWTLRPAASIAYMEDKAESYTDTFGVTIPVVTAKLGQAKAGPALSYRHVLADGTVLEPFGKVELIWNFENEATIAGVGVLNGEDAGPDGVRGRVEIGLKTMLPSGISLDLTGGLDGIGATGYSAYTGTARVRLPF